jgi:hypothetical protein
MGDVLENALNPLKSWEIMGIMGKTTHYLLDNRVIMFMGEQG